MANMKVGTRLGLGFGAVIALMIVIAIFGINGMRGMQSDIQDIVNDKFPKTVWANNMIDGINNIARAMRNALLETSKEKINKELERVMEARGEIKVNLDKLEDKVKSVEGKAVLAKVIEARTAYVGAQDTFLKLVRDGQQEEAKAFLLKDIRPLQLTYIQSIAKMVDFQSELMIKAGQDADKEVKTALMVIIALALIAIAAGVGIGFFIVRNLMKQLGGEPDYAAEAVGKIAGGDLGHNLALKAGDTSSLLYSLKTMQDSLRAIVAEIKSIVEAAAIRGDFSVKMSMEGKAGYTKELSDLLNSLSDVSDTGLNDVTRVATALANGDLSQRITKDYPGVFGQTKNGVNSTVDALTKIVGEIKKIVEDAAVRGDFSTKMDMEGKQGYTKELSDLLNQLSTVTETGLNDVLRVANPLRRTRQGAYALWERTLFMEEADPAQGLAGFFRYGVANPDVHQSDWSGSVGLRYRGLLEGRDDDTAGIATTRSHASAKYRLLAAATYAETVVEATYRTQIKPWLALQPVAQYIRQPNMNPLLKNVWVVAVRAEVIL